MASSTNFGDTNSGVQAGNIHGQVTNNFNHYHATAASLDQNAERNDLLRSLRWSDPTSDKDRIERTKGGLYEAASSWILAHPSYLSWLNDESKLLWIKGGDGKGKTMLLITIIKHLLTQTRLVDPAADTVITFFFCQNTDNSLNNAVAVLKGLIYSLLIQDCSLLSILQEQCHRKGTEVFDPAMDPNAFDTLISVFKNMVRNTSAKKVYLIVDALDECDKGQANLIDLIQETSQEDRLKWIVTSRNNVTVDESLALSLEVNAEAIQTAIRVYIEYKVSRISLLKTNPTLRQQVQRKLVDRAEGTFLWVDLVLKMMRSFLSGDIIRRIDDTPKGLTQLYERMMRDVSSPENLYRDQCVAVLSVVTLAFRPLHLLELQSLAGLPTYARSRSDMERIVDLCGSFIVQIEDSIYPIHQSAKDHLQSSAASSTMFPNGKHTIHDEIVKRSIQGMIRVLKRDIYELRHPGILVDEAVPPPRGDPLLSAGYACVYWINHAVEAKPAGARREDLQLLVDGFFRKRFLHWLEALSLLRSIANGVAALTAFLEFIEKTSDGSFELILDAYRFARLNDSVIKEAPLQTYVSALTFSPHNSAIRQLFSKEEPEWILNKPIVRRDSLASVRVFHTKGPRSFAAEIRFSSSDLLIATTDYSLEVWDISSDQRLMDQDLDKGDRVLILPNNKYIAIYSGFEIRILHIETGVEVRKFKIPSSPGKQWGKRSSEAIFNPDGHCIVAVLKGDEVAVLNIDSDEYLSHFTLPTSDDSRVELDSLSPRGSHYLCVYQPRFTRKSVVRVWETNSGRQLCTIKIHRAIWHVAWSLNGELVALVFDREIKFFSTSSGKRIHSISNYNPSSTVGMDFSSDPSRIIMGNNNSVEIHDIQSKQALHILQQSYEVTAVASSPIDGVYASGTSDGLIRVWDTKLIRSNPEFDNQLESIHNVFLSPDRSFVAVETSENVQILGGELNDQFLELPGSITSGQFSTDNSMFAAICHNKSQSTVRIWDTQSGVIQYSLNIDCPSQCSLSLSSANSVILGVGRFLSIWDLESGEISNPLNDTRYGTHETSKDGRFLCLFDGDGDGSTACIYEVQSQKQLCELTDKFGILGYHDWIEHIALAPDKTYAVIHTQGRFRLWHLQPSPEVIHTVGVELYYLPSDTRSDFYREYAKWPIFSPDGKYLVFRAEENQVVSVLDLQKDYCITNIEVHHPVVGLWFETGHGTTMWLRTNAERIKIQTCADINSKAAPGWPEISVSLQSETMICSIDKGNWIYLHGERAIKIPPYIEWYTAYLSKDGTLITLIDFWFEPVMFLRLARDVSIYP